MTGVGAGGSATTATATTTATPTPTATATAALTVRGSCSDGGGDGAWWTAEPVGRCDCLRCSWTTNASIAT